jgi:hypothetical protein
MGESSLVAPLSKADAEACGGKRAPVRGHKERQVTCRACVDNVLKLREKGNLVFDGMPVPILVLLKAKPSIAYVLAS